MNSVSYGQFSAVLHSAFGNERVPLEATLEMTHRCPLNCQHCYNNLPMGDLEARKRELSKEEYFAILDELVAMGVFWVLFTGGEVFARKDFLEIYTYAKRKGFLITIFTNGILINEIIADHLREYPPFAIEITLYGHTRETYDSMTQLPGAYDRCMRGIRLLLDRGLPLKLKTVATTVNKHEVASMKQFAEEDLGVEFKFDSLINPRTDCSHAPLGVRLTPEDVVAIDLHWPKTADEHRKNLARELSATPGARDTIYSCGGGLRSFAIDPFGNMSICVISHRENYNVRSGSVHEGWEQFLMEVRSKPRTRPTKCSACRIRTVCSMCPATGELENGDPESPVEFLCEVAHLRALAMGFEIPGHGDCEFCRDGSQREELVRSAKRIKSRNVDPEQWIAPRQLLPVLNNSSASIGCGGCRAH